QQQQQQHTTKRERGIVALWSLAVLSFERFFVICRPLGNIRLRGKHAMLGLMFVWTFSFICTFPPVLGWNSYTLLQKLKKVTRMVVVMIVAFMVGWTPYAAFSILVTACPTIQLDPRFRKCLIQLFTGKATIPESHINQTSERPGITAESQTGEMSAIAAHIRVGAGCPATPLGEDPPSDCSTFAQLPIPENKVCPM
ncbi:hypothetical protein CRUP_006419, partial [Coryphaenoides rupestris]